MQAFGFRTAGEIRFGRGTAYAAIEDIAAMSGRILLVTGATPGRSEWMLEGLTRRGCKVTGLSVAAEPDLEMIEIGLKRAREDPPGIVVGLGGGAVIDAAKALAALIPSPRPAMDHLEVVGSGLPLEAAPLPFVAMPTTAGTGAEVTKNAVIGVPAARRKVSLRDDRMLADLAVVDPSLTDGAPRAVTLASGLDAVTQVIEPYLSNKSNPLTDALCRTAIAPGLDALARLMADEDEDARDNMAWVSLSGGLALANAGLGAVHGLAGPVGGVSGAAHGAICGALLPHVLRVNAAEAGGAVAARMAEIDGWIRNALGERDLAEWSRDQGLPGLGEMGLAEGDLDAVAEAAATSSSMRGNRVALSPSQLVAILRAAW